APRLEDRLAGLERRRDDLMRAGGRSAEGLRDNAGMIRLIVGLGNPGAEYEDTRHNAGFWWVDQAARQLGAQLMHDRAYHAFVARVNRSEGPVWLQQPLTYMNLSGKAVAPLARFFKI